VKFVVPHGFIPDRLLALWGGESRKLKTGVCARLLACRAASIEIRRCGHCKPVFGFPEPALTAEFNQYLHPSDLMVQAILLSHGYDAVIAENGTSALKVIEHLGQSCRHSYSISPVVGEW
jgi:hypothetical protein